MFESPDFGSSPRPFVRRTRNIKLPTTTKAAARQAIYRQIQRRLNAVGPFVPLLQPTQVFVSTKDLRGAAFNAQYQVDVTHVSPR